MSFGKNLRALIEENDMTQKEVAKQLNIAPSTIGSYIHDTREPDFTTIKQIADFFHVSIDYLLDHQSPQYFSRNEEELLRTFRALTEEQQRICIEQSKVLLKLRQND